MQYTHGPQGNITSDARGLKAEPTGEVVSGHFTTHFSAYRAKRIELSQNQMSFSSQAREYCLNQLSGMIHPHTPGSRLFGIAFRWGPDSGA